MVSKKIIVYECQNCKAQYPKWQGRCTECGAWGSIREVIIDLEKGGEKKISFDETRLFKFSEIKVEEYKRIKTKFKKINELLGGGFVKGSLILLSGEPGIGKSTLSFELGMFFSGKVLYVSGEESPYQIKTRLS